jgi:NTP pyrophosphatase (non-canonical NTP hydrolase)
MKIGIISENCRFCGGRIYDSMEATRYGSHEWCDWNNKYPGEPHTNLKFTQDHPGIGDFEKLEKKQTQSASRRVMPTFSEISAANKARQVSWNQNDLDGQWTTVDWSNAAAGEMGEVCNAVKKYRRVQIGTKNISEPGRQISNLGDLKEKVGEEIADVFIYLDLLAQDLGLNMEEEIVKKFNATSEKYGFPDRL